VPQELLRALVLCRLEPSLPRQTLSGRTLSGRTLSGRTQPTVRRQTLSR
jgi:hypothetical protein